jgi:hypothetical protein
VIDVQVGDLSSKCAAHGKRLAEQLDRIKFLQALLLQRYRVTLRRRARAGDAAGSVGDALRCAPCAGEARHDDGRETQSCRRDARGGDVDSRSVLAAAPFSAPLWVRCSAVCATCDTTKMHCVLSVRRGVDFRYNCRLQLQTERQAKLEWAKERDHAHVSQLAVRNGSSRALLNVQSPTHRAHQAHARTCTRLCVRSACLCASL